MLSLAFHLRLRVALGAAAAIALLLYTLALLWHARTLSVAVPSDRDCERAALAQCPDGCSDREDADALIGTVTLGTDKEGLFFGLNAGGVHVTRTRTRTHRPARGIRFFGLNASSHAYAQSTCAYPHMQHVAPPFT